VVRNKAIYLALGVLPDGCDQPPLANAAADSQLRALGKSLLAVLQGAGQAHTSYLTAGSGA
jgi:hypothetical protein